MKDIDFDELDKAVNSLMAETSLGDHPEEKPPKDEAVVTIKPSLQADDSSRRITPKDLSSAVSNTLSEQNSEKPAAREDVPKSPAPESAPVIKRRTGRFMDVVHTPPVARDESARPAASRTGLTISPPESEKPAEEKTDESKDEEVNANVDKITTPENVVDENEKSRRDTDDWQSGGDFGTKDEPETAEPDTEEAEPLVSPFLPDAKVEKRPLGSPAPEAEMPAEYETTASGQSPEDQLPADPDQGLPQELQDELLAVESDTSMQFDGEPEPEEKPEADSPAETPAKPLSTSIPQQYKPEPSVPDETEGDVFDTRSYHQPIIHPAKRKSGWLWVLGIVLLILLGAGAGAAVYLLAL